MAEAERILAALGAVPAGAQTKTMLAGDENQAPGYYQTDPLSNLFRALQVSKLTIEDKLKKQQESTTKKIDMYKTLREAGYDPKNAYEAVIKGTMQSPGLEDNSLTKKTTRERILGKLSKGETLSAGEQQVYDDTIKHKPAGLGDDILDNVISEENGIVAETPNQKNMREKILTKISTGEKLSLGEQKIYDEVIKKGQNKPPEDLNAVLNPGDNEMIPVISPAGIKGSVPKSKLAAALKAGFKKR